MNKNKPFFSILVPVYNVEIYLEKCIESILGQTYKNFEVILVNDGSKDSSKKICEKYAKSDGRIKFYNQENMGLILARRRGIKEAKGNYYLFLDSDDYWETELLFKIKKQIDDTKSDLILFRYRRVDENNKNRGEGPKLFSESRKCTKKEIMEKIASSSDVNNLVCKVAKENIVNNDDYSDYREIKNAEDLLQSLPIISKSTQIYYVDEILYNYRVTRGSITNKFNIQKYRDVKIVRKEVLKYLNKLECNSSEIQYAFYSFYINSMEGYILELMNAKIDKKEKKRILAEIREDELIKDGIKSINKNMFKNNVIRICLKKRYFLLSIMGVLNKNIKKLKNIVR